MTAPRAGRIVGLAIVLLLVDACHAEQRVPAQSASDTRVAIEEPAALFAEMPAQVDVAAAFLADYDEPVPAPILAVMRRVAKESFTSGRVAAVGTGPDGAFSQPVMAALDHFRAALARTGRVPPSAPAAAATMSLAASLPNVGMRAEQGLTALRMWVVLGTVAHKLPKQMVEMLYANRSAVVASVPGILASTRSSGEAGTGYPAMAKARDAAIADNIAVLDALTPEDVRVLAAYYTGPDGRARTAALVKAFAAANDAANAAAITAFYPEAARLVTQY